MKLSTLQEQAVTAIYESNKLLIAPMGSGKTIIAGTAIQELLDNKELTRVLIITTPQIASAVWPNELQKWPHTQHITCKTAQGTPKQRLKVIHDQSIQIVTLSFNSVKWFVDNKLYKLFDGLLIDESSKIKSSGTQAVKALRRKNVLSQFKWCCAMTGTPTNEHIANIFSQMLIVDGGKSLGTNYRNFCVKYFNTEFFDKFVKITPRRDTVEHIFNAIKNYVHYVDYDKEAELPAINMHRVYIDMPVALVNKYKTFKKEGRIDEIKALSKPVLLAKLQQICCGFIYDTLEETEVFYSDYREQELLKLLSSFDRDEKVLIVYQYNISLARLCKLLPEAVVFESKDAIELTERWNNGDIKYLLLQPAKAAHGLQLEKGGSTIVWYSPQYSNDKFEQTNARLWRRGQTKEVNVYELIAEDSIDNKIINRVRQKQDNVQAVVKKLKQSLQ